MNARAITTLEKRSEDSLRCLRYEVEERFVRLRLASDAREDDLRQELGRADARAAAAERRLGVQSAEFAAQRAALAGEVQRRMRAALLKKMLPVVRAQLAMELRDEVRAELRAEAEAEAAVQLRENAAYQSGGGAPQTSVRSARRRAVEVSAENVQHRRAHVGTKSARRAQKLKSKRPPQRRVKATAAERGPQRERGGPAVSWRSPLCEIHSVAR